VGIDMMIKDALILSNEHFNFLEKIVNPEEYVKLDDYIIQTIANFTEEDGADLYKAAGLINRLRYRDLYTYVGELSLKENPDKEKLKADFLTINNPNNAVKEVDLEFYFFAIDYGFGDKNPFDYIHFYRAEDDFNSFTISSNKVSAMIPSVFKEYYLRVYCKDKAKHEAAKGMFDSFNKKLSEEYASKCNFTTPHKKKEYNFLSFKREREEGKGIGNGAIKFNKFN
jgi:hypothetical protein